MKHALLILFAAICFSSCTVENHYIQYDKPKEAREVRVVREPQRTTTVSYHVNTTPVIRTYHYAPPVVYRSYNYRTNYPSHTSGFRMLINSGQYRVSGCYHAPVVYRRHRF